MTRATFPCRVSGAKRSWIEGSGGGKQRAHPWQVGIGLLNPVYSRMGPNVTCGELSVVQAQVQPPRADVTWRLSSPRDYVLSGHPHPWVHLQFPTGSQEGVNKLTSSPQFSPTPIYGHSPWPDPRHILSVPFSPLCRYFLPVSSSSPSSLSLDDYERCSSCPRLPITALVPAPGVGTPYKLPTTTFRKSNIPAGTQGQDRAFQDPVPVGTTFSCV